MNSPDHITNLVRSCVCLQITNNIADLTTLPGSIERTQHIINAVDQFIADFKPANNLSTVRRKRVIGELIVEFKGDILNPEL